MSQENVEVVRRMYEAFHAGDAERALARFDPEAVVDATNRVDGGIGRGHGGVTEVIGQWLDAFDEWSETLYRGPAEALEAFECSLNGASFGPGQGRGRQRGCHAGDLRPKVKKKKK